MEFDYVIVNKDFDRAYADLIHIYRAERMKPGRNPWLPDFVTGLVEEEGTDGQRRYYADCVKVNGS